MKTLFIDTHLFDLHIILFNNNEILREKHIMDKKNNSTLLMPSIKEVISDDTFDEIIVVNGPGSFTGVRLGVTIAKTLAYTLDVPIKTVTSLDLMAYSNNKDGIYAFSDNNGYYIGKYENNSHEEYFYLNNKEYENFANDNNVITDVKINYQNVLNSLKNINSINPHAVKPIYVKLIGVEYDKKN